MRIMRTPSAYDKQKAMKDELIARQCLNEFIALCNTDNQDHLRILQKKQLDGYTKWRKKHMNASPWEFFNS